MTSIYYYTLFSIFTIIAVMIVVDQNVGDYIILLTKILKVNIERIFWMIRFHPFWFTNPIGQRLMMRKYEKMFKDDEKRR